MKPYDTDIKSYDQILADMQGKRTRTDPLRT